MEVSMSEKDIIKAVEYIDNIKSEWITNVTDRLNEFENSSGISLNEMDDEYKYQILQHMSWLFEEMKLLKSRIEKKRN